MNKVCVSVYMPLCMYAHFPIKRFWSVCLSWSCYVGWLLAWRGHLAKENEILTKHYTIWEPQNWQILCSRETTIGGFWDVGIAKYSVGIASSWQGYSMGIRHLEKEKKEVEANISGLSRGQLGSFFLLPGFRVVAASDVRCCYCCCCCCCFCCCCCCCCCCSCCDSAVVWQAAGAKADECSSST